MTIKINSDRTAAVDHSYYWRAINDNPPMGVKLQLLTVGGVAVYGQLTAANKTDFVGWAACPKKPDWM